MDEVASLQGPLQTRRNAMKDDPKSIARKSYQAYVDKDRATIEAVLSDDFHFTSPLDNRLNREAYFDRCRKNSETIAGFKFVNLVNEESMYSCPTKGTPP